MVLTKPRTRAAIAGAAIAVATVVTGALIATTAQAAETTDPRATAHDGNAAKCADAGLLGEIIDPDDLEYTDGEINVDQSVTITGVPDLVVVTGIVVKGGDAYNVYEPGKRGLPLTVPWEDLVAPLNDGGQQPALSHWFVCGTPDTPPSTDPSEPSEPSEPPSSEPSEPSEPPSSEPTDPSEPSDPASSTTPADDETTTSTEPGAAVDDDDLAVTGFSAGWLIPIGALLLLGGGAALWMARSRREA